MKSKIKNEQFFITLRKYLQIYLVKNRNCSENTIKSYTDSLNLYFAYMESERKTPLCKIDWECFNYENVSSFIVWLSENRGCGRQTQVQRLTAIRSFISYAGILDASAMLIQADIEKVKLRKPARKLVPYLTREELTVFLAQPDSTKSTGLRDMMFLILMYDTAARCQEMLDLTIGNLVLNVNSPFVYLTGMGEKARTIPLMPKTVLHLEHYLERFHPLDTRSNDDYLFYTVSHREHHCMSEDNAEAFVKKYGISAKSVCPSMPEHLHPHMLRHTRAMHWYQGGMPLTMLSELLGHAQIETTKVYAYADTAMKREAIEKANCEFSHTVSDAIWKNDDEMIRKLTGLK